MPLVFGAAVCELAGPYRDVVRCDATCFLVGNTMVETTGLLVLATLRCDAAVPRVLVTCVGDTLGITTGSRM